MNELFSPAGLASQALCITVVNFTTGTERKMLSANFGQLQTNKETDRDMSYFSAEAKGIFNQGLCMTDQLSLI